jgi:NRAMP (natural resistance-associated macrophage protein)-like metal ion transporter
MSARKTKSEVQKPGRVQNFFSTFGPGIITGAADDDPAGIATYSVAGAKHGLGLLYTAFFTWPLMAAVQMMCARVGMVTGQGLIGSLRKKFPKPLIVVAAFSLFAANTLNIGADLAGMGDAAEMLTHINSKVFVILFGGAIAVATVEFSYQKIAKWLKWLALALFAYVACAFLVVEDWSKVASATLIPQWPKDNDAWKTTVAILGTTISPYLFFWQASQEVEEKKSKGRRSEAQREGATSEEIQTRKWDVGIGTFFSNLVMYFVILTTAVTLHLHGVTEIETSRQAAEALKPLAGNFATLLYTLGVVAVGFLAIPTLAGSAAYAFAETFRWKQGLDEKPQSAKRFYFVVVISTALGICFDFIGFNPIRALFWSAIVNGVLAPFLLVGILVVAANKELMKGQPSYALNRWIVGLTAVIMFGAAAALFML